MEIDVAQFRPRPKPLMAHGKVFLSVARESTSPSGRDQQLEDMALSASQMADQEVLSVEFSFPENHAACHAHPYKQLLPV